MTHDEALRAARLQLAAAGIESAALDARLLAGAAFGLDRIGLMTAGDRPADPARLDRLAALIARRADGEPVGRILGRREFHGLDFRLGPDTLEPRPDTETLVDLAIALVRSGGIPRAAEDGAGLLFADVGTGTGAIAIALLAALPGARAIATDIAPGALAVAADNGARHGVAGRLELRLGSYLEPLAGEALGLVVSNPPYIASAVVDGLDRSVRDHDPRRALDGGADGLDGYRALAAGAATVLAPGGALAVEIGFDQATAVTELLAIGGLISARTVPDLAGRDRVVTALRPEKP